MTDYPIWDDELFVQMLRTIDVETANKIINAIVCRDVFVGALFDIPVLGDVRSCLSAKSIILTFDDFTYIFHPVNDDEEEVMLRLRYDNVKVLFRRDDV